MEDYRYRISISSGIVSFLVIRVPFLQVTARTMNNIKLTSDCAMSMTIRKDKQGLPLNGKPCYLY